MLPALLKKNKFLHLAMVLTILIADVETMTSEKIPGVKVDNEIFKNI